MISVIIPTKNEERLIGLLLESLSQQTCAKQIEVIVADAFSSDRTRAVVETYRSAFRNLRIVDGGMPWTGRNLGAKASSGDLLCFIDADLIIPDTHFLSTIETLFQKKNLVIASIYLKPNSEKIADRILVGLYNIILYLAQYIRPLGAMCIVATRDAYEKSGGYPEDVVMAEDHDFVLNATKYGRYAVLPLRANFSVRRFEKEGRLGLVYKYLQATFHHVIHGPITKPIFDYEFEYKDEHLK